MLQLCLHGEVQGLVAAHVAIHPLLLRKHRLISREEGAGFGRFVFFYQLLSLLSVAFEFQLGGWGLFASGRVRWGGWGQQHLACVDVNAANAPTLEP